MARVCLDTNIWISGIVFGGAPARIVQLAFERKFIVVTSTPILDEVSRILQSKFEVPRQDVKRLTRRIMQVADVFEPSGELKVIDADPDDDLIIETAVIGKARLLVSGDKKHILPLKRFRHVRIVSAQEFLQTL